MELARPTPKRSLTGSLTLARLQARLQRVDRRKVVAAVLAIIVASVVQGAVVRARATVAALGTTRPVAVAIVAIDPGTELDAGLFRIEDRPVGHVPDGALGEEAIGRSASATITAGEIIVASRLLDGSEAIGGDERAVTIPMPLAPPPVDVGDVVELVGVNAADGPFASPAQLLATGRVVSFDEAAITVSTSPREAMAVVTHLGAGAVDVLLTPYQATGQPTTG